MPELISLLTAWHQQYKLTRIWADQSQPMGVQALIGAGLPVVANQVRDVEYGVRVLYAALKTRRLRVDPKRCPQLLDEMRRYAWKTDRAGHATGRVPVDRFNHCIDCVRFILVGEGETPDQDPANAVPPEDQPTLYRGDDGVWRDNVKATLARRKASTVEALMPPTWDDDDGDAFADPEDDNDHIKELAKFLNMREPV